MYRILTTVALTLSVLAGPLTGPADAATQQCRVNTASVPDTPRKDLRWQRGGSCHVVFHYYPEYSEPGQYAGLITHTDGTLLPMDQDRLTCRTTFRCVYLMP